MESTNSTMFGNGDIVGCVLLAFRSVCRIAVIVRLSLELSSSSHKKYALVTRVHLQLFEMPVSEKLMFLRSGVQAKIPGKTKSRDTTAVVYGLETSRSICSPTGIYIHFLVPVLT